MGVLLKRYMNTVSYFYLVILYFLWYYSKNTIGRLLIIKNNIIQWIKSYFADEASPATKAVIGISGGKDSTIAAALCVQALGKDRVLGVLMPQGEQEDIGVSYEVCRYLGIEHMQINIGDTVKSLYDKVSDILSLNTIATFNTPARIRMTTLYAVSAIVDGRVVNTCNASETYVGWGTKFGDIAGDFSPLCDLTVTEVKAIGHELGLPFEFVEKIPIDGLCGKTDEEGLGFSYDVLDRFIRHGVCEDEQTKARIMNLHNSSEHKRNSIPRFRRT
jgi:NAD+ synthase